MTELLGAGVVKELRCTTMVLAVIANGVVAGFVIVVDGVDVLAGLGAVVDVEITVGFVVVVEVVEVVNGFIIVVDVIGIVTGFVRVVIDAVALNIVELVEATFKVCTRAADANVLVLAVIVTRVDMVGNAAKAFIVVAAMTFWNPKAEDGQRQLQSHAPPGCMVPVPWTIAAKADWVAIVGLIVVNVETKLGLLVLATARTGACRV